MNRAGMRRWLALALELGALALIAAALSGARWLDPGPHPAVLVLVDRSASVPREAADGALAQLEAGPIRRAGAALRIIEFAGRAAGTSGGDGDATPDLDRSATDIEAALEAALAVHAAAPVERLVVVSDGHANVGDTARGLQAVRDAGLPLHWIVVARAPASARVAQVLAPGRATAGQPLTLSLELTGEPDRRLEVEVRAWSAGGESELVRLPARAGWASVEVPARAAGALRLDVTLRDADSGTVLHAWPDVAVVDVAPRAPILYVHGGAGAAPADSLVRGGWALDRVHAVGLDRLADGLAAYRAVVLDDVSADDAGERFWQALADAVQQRGLGLLVLGGERSFGHGAYRGSRLEAVLPVLSEPPALDRPAAIVFVVDKSGSMGRGSGDVDRLQLAQRAVVETARSLGPKDSAGLVVFDVEPRVLLPLTPADAALDMLERVWPVGPRGGTRLAPALETAIDELDRSGAARRLLVVVTDGFVDTAALAGLRERLARARIETIALGVGADADMAALGSLIGPAAGRILRVDEAALLVRAMPRETARQRAPVERGRLAVTQRHPLPFAPGLLEDWPAVAAYHATRARPQSLVAVQSAAGDPLVAMQLVGSGRSAVVTSGLGAWVPDWRTWPAWGRLTGGLAQWVTGDGGGGATLSAVDDRPAVIEWDLDLQAADMDARRVSVTVDTPAARGVPAALAATAPRRLRATLPASGPGLYTLTVTTPQGRSRHLHLRPPRDEQWASGPSPALQGWRDAGLVSTDDVETIAATAGRRPVASDRRSPDRGWVVLGLALFVAGILVERVGARPWPWRLAPSVLAAWRRARPVQR